MIRNAILGYLLIVSLILQAQTSLQLNPAEIKLGLKKLNVLGSVLYIAAHPDDENTQLLAYLAKDRKVRTGYLSLTRGDGGQNLIGNEQSELLGLIRTYELLAARKVDGAEQFFTRANDFGFSKNPGETFRIWDKEQILADAVWVIRKFKPDVIIAGFPENTTTHGHHTASAIIAREAFAAAADPKKFPEQLKAVQIWQAKRILLGGRGGTGQLRVNTGSYNPLLAKGYGQIAAESRSNHKSQGFGTAIARGQSFTNFTLISGEAANTDPFEGVDLSWKRVSYDKISNMIAEADQAFDMENPAKSVNSLINILTEIEAVKDDYWRNQKMREIKDLISACSGLWFESYATEPSYAKGSNISLRYQAIVQNNIPVTLKSIVTETSEISPNTTLTNGILQSNESTLPAKKITQPYWLAEDHPIGAYIIPDQQFVGNPENTDRLTTTFTFLINGKSISFERLVVNKYTDPVRGEVYRPLVVAPPVTATISEKAYVFGNKDPKKVVVNLKSFSANVQGSLEATVPAGWKISPAVLPLNFATKGEEQQVEFTLTPSATAKPGMLSLAVKIGNETFRNGLKEISYDHIPYQTLFPPSEAQLVNIDLKTDVKNIAYLDGAGDLIPESLRQLGYTVSTLTENTILNTDLSVYDAIITGVRAYNVNERIKFMQPKLLEYVNNGGTLLVQYNNNARLVVPNIGPYPFTVSNGRVTDENAKITMLAPADPALNYPNKITEADFNDWIQERGLYYVSNLDKNYIPVLSMSDPNEDANTGSLIIGNYGKGKFVYTSLAFFRQLPAGVPGAYRLFVNLMAKRK